MKEEIERLYNSIMDKPRRVLGIFNDFFGEDRVDMQGYKSLDEFISWIYNEPVATYFPNNITIGMTNAEWNLYGGMPICHLPVRLMDKAVMSLEKYSVMEKIGILKFTGIFILVHFPHVRVTNENNRFVDINHLWAKVKICYNGTMVGGFALNRSEYTMLHISSNYLHSHVGTIPKNNFAEFQNPCTGTGPINGTITTLNRDYDVDMWNMFCLELSKYVTVESIEGRPYRYLEKLGTNNMEVMLDRFIAYTNIGYFGGILPNIKLEEFVKHFVNKKSLKFNYVNGSYSIGMSIVEYITLISNEFISWYNELFNKKEVNISFNKLKEEKILEECIIDNGKVYYETGRTNINEYTRYVGSRICTFKGKEITLAITDLVEVRNENKTIILNTQIALYILTTILKVLNYRYGRETNTTEGNQPCAKARYL